MKLTPAMKNEIHYLKEEAKHLTLAMKDKDNLKRNKGFKN